MKRETLLTAQQEMAIHFPAVTDPGGYGVGGWGGREPWPTLGYKEINH